jgi:hypothetical protein
MAFNEIILMENPRNGGSPARERRLIKIIILVLRWIFTLLISLISLS